MEKVGSIVSKEKKKIKDEELDQIAGGGEYEDTIKQLAEKGIITGYDLDDFKPKETPESLINKIVATGICPLCKKNISSTKHDIYSFESAKKHIYEECDVYKNW